MPAKVIDRDVDTSQKEENLDSFLDITPSCGSQPHEKMRNLLLLSPFIESCLSMRVKLDLPAKHSVCNLNRSERYRYF